MWTCCAIRTTESTWIKFGYFISDPSLHPQLRNLNQPDGARTGGHAASPVVLVSGMP